MKIYWNTDARQITFDIESGISAPRYSKLPLELFFQKGTYPNNLDSYLLPEDTVVHAILKPEGAYNTNTALAGVIGAGFTTPATGVDPYIADLNLNTVSVDSLFRQLGNPEAIKCTMVLLYRPANIGDWVVSPQMVFILENAVATGYEGAPSPAPQGIVWGDITGEIEDQTDLVDYVNGRTVNVQVFQSSGTWTKPLTAHANSPMDILIVNGGCGGYGGGVASGGRPPGIAGGAAGNLRRITHLFAGGFGTTEPVIIGAGGAGGAGRSDIDPEPPLGAGEIGGVSSFAGLTPAPVTSDPSLGALNGVWDNFMLGNSLGGNFDDPFTLLTIPTGGGSGNDGFDAAVPGAANGVASGGGVSTVAFPQGDPPPHDGSRCGFGTGGGGSDVLVEDGGSVVPGANGGPGSGGGGGAAATTGAAGSAGGDGGDGVVIVITYTTI